MTEHTELIHVDGEPAVAVTVTPMSQRHGDLADEIWSAVEDVIDTEGDDG